MSETESKIDINDSTVDTNEVDTKVEIIVDDDVEETKESIEEENRREREKPLEEQLIESFTKEALDLIHEWSNEQFGSMSEWFELGSSVKDLVDNSKDVTQIDKISLSLDVIHNVAKEVMKKYGDRLNEEQMEVVKYFVSDTHNNVLSGVIGFVKSLLNKIDTNKDGKISKEECNAWCSRVFCCAPKLSEKDLKEMEK